MKVNSRSYQTSDKTQIVSNLHDWLRAQGNAEFFTTCYKTRAVGVFVQYETIDRNSEPYLYAADQGVDEVSSYITGWLNAIFQKDVVFKVEERERIGFSIFITLEKKENISDSIEVTEDDIEVKKKPEEKKPDPVLKESEKRSMEEIVVTATTSPISRSMDNNVIVQEETIEGIRRSNLPLLKVKSHTTNIDKKVCIEKKKQVGRKAEYNWDKLSELYKKHNGSVTKIARDLGCSGPAVRRQIKKWKENSS